MPLPGRRCRFRDEFAAREHWTPRPLALRSMSWARRTHGTRDARQPEQPGGSSMLQQHIWRDFQHAARSLLRSPGFAAAAIVTIALGVGVNTGVFSVLNGLLFRDLPAPDAHELVSIYPTFEGIPNRRGSALGEVSTAEYERYRDATTTLSGILATGDPWRLTLGGESPLTTAGLIVSCNYFDVLEQRAALGRALQASDCEPGAGIAVMIGYEFWTTAFGADRSIVGRTLEINRQLVTVVGVAPEGAYGGSYEAAFFGPVSAQPLLDPADGDPARGGAFGDERTSWLFMIGRRADGASIAEVRAELAVIAAQIDLEQPGRSTTLRVERAKPLLAPFVLFPYLAWALPAVVMTAFGLILLIACANVANLLLARATVRAREIAVRLSLGASRARVVQQLLAESLLIALVGGALGAVLALVSFQLLATRAIPALSPPGIPTLAVDPSPDLRVLTFTLAVTFATALLFGLAPALRASNPNLDTVIRQDSAGAGSGPRGGKLRGVLVGTQVALCMLLMIGTGLMLRGLYATRTVDPGFRYDDVAYASFDLEGAGYGREEAAAFWPRLLEAARTMPGIDGAAYALREPLSSDGGGTGIRLPGETNTQWRSAGRNDVSPDYFSVVGIPIVRGRTFTNAELSDDARSVIVSAATAAELWPNDEPLGKTLSMATGFGPGQEVELEVVGIVRDAQVTSLGQIDPRYVYMPASPRSALGSRELLVRSRLELAATAAGLRVAVRSIDAGLAVVVSPLEANLAWWRGLASIVTTLAATAGALALVLAAVGVYGVVAFFVSRTMREIGIRLALGASPPDVLRLIVKRTVRPVVIGAALGIAAAVPASQILSSVLFGVSPLDPLGLGGAAAFVIGVALMAGGLAARRAARVDPMVTLRHD
jgi:putative ABC transport system permease protein